MYGVFYILWLHGHNDPSDEEETGVQKLEAFAGLPPDSVVLGWSILAGYYTCGVFLLLYPVMEQVRHRRFWRQ